MLVDDVAVGILDPLDEVGLYLLAVIGQRREGLSHFERGHRLGADDHGGDLLDRGLDAEAVGHLDDVVGPGGQGNLAVDGVGGEHGGILQAA